MCGTGLVGDQERVLWWNTLRDGARDTDHCAKRQRAVRHHICDTDRTHCLAAIQRLARDRRWDSTLQGFVDGQIRRMVRSTSEAQECVVSSDCGSAAQLSGKASREVLWTRCNDEDDRYFTSQSYLHTDNTRLSPLPRFGVILDDTSLSPLLVHHKTPSEWTSNTERDSQAHHLNRLAHTLRCRQGDRDPANRSTSSRTRSQDPATTLAAQCLSTCPTSMSTRTRRWLRLPHRHITHPNMRL